MTETLATSGRGPVVVAVDGTEDGERALRYGVEEAKRRGCGLRLVHVPHETIPMAPLLPLFSAPILHEVGAQILKDSERVARELAAGAVPVDIVLEYGPRVSAILHACDDARALVVAPRPASIAKLVVGSTTTGLAARAHSPVYSVPPGWRPATGHQRVVVGIDGSPVSAKVLQAAFDAAALRRAELVIVHAWRPTGQYDTVIGGRAFVREWVDTVEREVSELAAGPKETHPDVRSRIELRYERAAVAIAELAHGAGLLVLGRRGRGAPLGLLLGSTVRALIRSEVCPVEVVPV
jgi:nucleotide-binding universal stress UspA family protein